MADYKVTDAEFTYLADKIRAKGGTNDPLEWPTGFGEAVDNMSSAVVQPLSVTQNGTYNPPSGVDGYAPVTVNVSSGGDILTGTDAPSASLGNNGDIYIYRQYFPIASGVNFVEYLQATGTQYINTQIYANQDIDIYVRFKIPSAGNYTVVGARTGGYASFSKALFIGYNTDQNKVFGCKSGSNMNGDAIASLASNIGSWYEFRTFSKSINGSYNFTAKTNAKTFYNAIDQSPFTADNSLTLFVLNAGSSLTRSNIIISRVTIYDKGAPIADYLPCLDPNGVACMWDNIAQEYVYNDGTGNFLYGNTVLPIQLEDVYYLKENGVWSVIEQYYV